MEAEGAAGALLRSDLLLERHRTCIIFSAEDDILVECQRRGRSAQLFNHVFIGFGLFIRRNVSIFPAGDCSRRGKRSRCCE